jgi:hypothetical protein
MQMIRTGVCRWLEELESWTAGQLAGSELLAAGEGNEGRQGVKGKGVICGGEASAGSRRSPRLDSWKRALN